MNNCWICQGDIDYNHPESYNVVINKHVHKSCLRRLKNAMEGKGVSDLPEPTVVKE